MNFNNGPIILDGGLATEIERKGFSLLVIINYNVQYVFFYIRMIHYGQQEYLQQILKLYVMYTRGSIYTMHYFICIIVLLVFYNMGQIL